MSWGPFSLEVCLHSQTSKHCFLKGCSKGLKLCLFCLSHALFMQCWWKPYWCINSMGSQRWKNQHQVLKISATFINLIFTDFLKKYFLLSTLFSYLHFPSLLSFKKFSTFYLFYFYWDRFSLFNPVVKEITEMVLPQLPNFWAYVMPNVI